MSCFKASKVNFEDLDKNSAEFLFEISFNPLNKLYETFAENVASSFD